MTLAQLKQRVRDRLDEDSSSSQRYSDAVTQMYLIDGLRAYVTETGCQIGTFTITQEAYTLFYDVPCDFIQLQRISWVSGTTYYPLEGATTRDLDATIFKWQWMTDVRSRSYFMLGLNRIALWPMSADGGEEYVVQYRRDVYTGITLMPEQDHGLLVDYAVGRHLLTERKPVEASRHLKIFGDGVMAARRRMANADRTWGVDGKGL